MPASDGTVSGSAMARSRPAHAKTEHALLKLGWFTVPAHVGLGVWAWWLMLHDPDRLIELLAATHLLVPVVGLVTLRWWWSRWGELLVLLFINHAATFLVLMFLPWD